MRKDLISFVCFVLLLQFCYVAALSNVKNKQSVKFAVKSNKNSKLSREVYLSSEANGDISLIAKIGETSQRQEKLKNVVAKAMGYVMGAGAMFIYAPILIKLLRNKNADGFAISTWVFNVFGLSLATLYPMKKGFPISTYVDLLAATTQSAVILLLIGFYNRSIVPVSIFLVSTFLSFVAVLRMGPVSSKLLSMMQITASLLANYANFPQILLSFQTKHAAWSGITASLSMIGCFIRIFTTLQLTKDPVVLGGYLLGLFTNGILLGQIFIYKN